MTLRSEVSRPDALPFARSTDSARGRLYETSVQGVDSTWGEFVVFEAPLRVVFTWHPGLPRTAATEVEVQFRALGEATPVSLEHRDWERLGENASFVRGLFDGGWGPLLQRFVALASGQAELPAVVGPGCIGAVPGSRPE
jgi:hypothetical protein